MATQDDYVKTALRLPKALHARLQEAADATSKSMNSEIIARLESSFSGGDNAALISAIARLSTNLASAELEKHTAEIDASNLALSLQKAADMLLEQCVGNQQSSRIATEFIQEAKPYIAKARALEAELPSKVSDILEATKRLKESLGLTLARVGLQLDAPSGPTMPDSDAPNDGRQPNKGAR